MLTALTLRYDLMNQREILADDWREIKFQGDDLKSILNLQRQPTAEDPQRVQPALRLYVRRRRDAAAARALTPR